MDDYFEDKKRQEEEDKKEAEELVKKAKKRIEQSKHPFISKFFNKLVEAGEETMELVSGIGDELMEPLERQLYEILGEKIRWLTPVDKYELLQLPAEERIARIKDLKKKFELEKVPETTGAVVDKEDTSDISEEKLQAVLFPDIQEKAKTAEAFLLYQDKTFADVDWKYKDKPKRRDHMKRVLKQIFLRYQHEQGW